MVLKADQQRVRALLAETLTLLCKNGLHYKSEFSIEGLIGITLDQDEIFLVSIKETIKSPGAEKRSTDDGGANSGLSVDPSSISISRKRRQETADISFKSDTSFSDMKPAMHMSSSESSFHPARKNRRIRSPTSTHSQAEHQQPSASQTQNVNKPVSGVITFTDTSTIKADAEDDASASEDQQQFHGSGSTSAVATKNSTNDNELDNSLQGELSALQGESSRSSSTQKFDASPAPNILKSENVIEIKEEGDSTDDQSELANDYSVYENYGGMMFGGSDADTSQNYGESSGFHIDSQFGADGQDLGRGAASRMNQNFTCRDKIPLCASDAFVVPCPECGILCKSKNTLQLHIKNIHLQMFRYVCSICGKGHAGKGDLRGHMASKHGTPRDFRCHLCDKEYSYKSDYKKHMRSKHSVILPLLRRR